MSFLKASNSLNFFSRRIKSFDFNSWKLSFSNLFFFQLFSSFEFPLLHIVCQLLENNYFNQPFRSIFKHVYRSYTCFTFSALFNIWASEMVP